LHTLDTVSDDENEERPLPRRTPSNILEEDSDIGESWAVKGDGGLEGSGGEKKEEGGVGVLGLLYQFQKAQTEGRKGNI
jgi:autophagy-related protein 9